MSTYTRSIPRPLVSASKSSLCDRCNSLNLTPLLFFFQSDTDADSSSDPSSPLELGLAEEIRKRSTFCAFCRLVLEALGPALPDSEDGEPVWIVLTWELEDSRVDAQHSALGRLRVLSPNAQTHGPMGGLNLLPRDGLNMFPQISLLLEDVIDIGIPVKHGLARLVKDHIDFGMLRKWIRICKTAHGEACDRSPMIQASEDPTTAIKSFRVIDIVNNCLTLAPLNCEYIALSYVWGPIDPQTILRTLRSNVAQLEQAGSFQRRDVHEKIPLTIRHAMEVARHLQIRYLWVDSLCIIQDDDGREGSKMDAISKMDLVYGAAALTIMAATGTDANAGLPGVHSGSRAVRQPVEEIYPGFRLAYKQREADDVWKSVYYTRAWTFQERKFSRRTLRFIGGQAVFTCKAADYLREDVVCDEDEQSTQPVRMASASDTDPIGDCESLISSYSALQLTYIDDIYHAFAGFTRYFRQSLDLDLCHGIPTAYFDWFFLWIFGHVRRKNTPSWSWSGWYGQAAPHTLIDWDDPSTTLGRQALPERTWIIWYQRVAHDSVECRRVWTYPDEEADGPSSASKNFYGRPVKARFDIDCTRTLPTPRVLLGAPNYLEDTHGSFRAGSGFLQFWTVSVQFDLAPSTDPSREDDPMVDPAVKRSLVGIFGANARQIGSIFLHPDWCTAHVPARHEFILVCEGRAHRDERGMDDDDGWRYVVMLIEWHGEWAERVGVDSIDKRDLSLGVGGGLVWKEIILG